MPFNVLDRAISWYDPAAGVRRAAARITLDQIRSYDGAIGGRRTAGWRATNASANREIKGALPALRARSREVSRNTWWGARIKRTVVSHAVGTGITPKPTTGNKTLDRKARNLWKTWGTSCDAEGQLSIDAMIALACGCIVESGEVLGRLIPLPYAGGKRVPLEFQLLEPDHLDASRDRLTGQGEIVDQGIAYDLKGKRTAYWIHPQHPGALGIVMPTVSVRIDARDMLHAYRKDRIGQGRGVPWVAPVLLKGRDVADLEEAVVVKSRVEACIAAFIKTTTPSTKLSDRVSQEASDTGQGRQIETVSPGMVKYLAQGEELQSFLPSSSGQFESVLMTNWLTLAAGAGITYDQMTGDLRRANFSSLRAGKVEFRRDIEQFQHNNLVGMLLAPLWNRFIEAAIDAGLLPRRVGGYPCDWIMPANEPIDPLKDMQADLMAVRTGRMTWPQYVAAWGLDPDTQLDEIEAWFKDIDRRKIVLDSDPRQTLTPIKTVDDTEPPASEETANV